MKWLSGLSLLAAGALALPSCSTADRDSQPQSEPSVRATDPSEPSTAPEAEPAINPKRVSVQGGPGLTDAQHETARAFVRFAAAPSPTTARKVPFSGAAIAISVNGHSRRLPSADVPNPDAWFTSDGEGTTSALFVISNSVEKAAPGPAAFRATRARLPICNLDEGENSTAELNLIFVTLANGTECADGFRIEIILSDQGDIDGVALAVRAP